MIIFGRSSFDTLIDYAVKGAPEEVCGVLAGSVGEFTSRVTSVHPVQNAAANPRSEYVLDPEGQYEILTRLETAGEDVVGFYHSHPDGPSQPSTIDANRATWSGVSYVIIVLNGHPYVGSWRWINTEFIQEPVGLENRGN